MFPRFAPAWSSGAVLAAFLVAWSVGTSLAQAGDTRTDAEFSRFGGRDVIELVPTWRRNNDTPKAYIGECRGFVHGSKRKIRLSDNRASGEQVHIVDSEREADNGYVFCTDD